MAANVMEIYGSKVFNEHVMKERLPSATYKSLEKTLHKGAPLDIEVANVVASVMKRWAMELGATHFPSSSISAPYNPKEYPLYLYRCICNGFKELFSDAYAIISPL